VLIAELICGELARALGLPVPELVFVELDPALGNNEPDFEIQNLVAASGGLNLALDYLPGSLGLDPLSITGVEPGLASAIVWFDAFITNVDRTPRNTNMLWWHRNVWLIDHGAALYVHHTWKDYRARARSPFPAVRDHVLLPIADRLHMADDELAPRVTAGLLEQIVAAVPDTWLQTEPTFTEPEMHRSAYLEYLMARISEPRAFVEEAMNARAQRF
jgi:hypothetical protein